MCSVVDIVTVTCAIPEDHTVPYDISGMNDGMTTFIVAVCLLLVFSQPPILVVEGTICQNWGPGK